MPNQTKTTNKTKQIIIKIILTIITLIASAYLGIMWMILIAFSKYFNNIFSYLIIAEVIIGILILIWKFSKKNIMKIGSLVVLTLMISCSIAGYKRYEESLVINTTPNINVHEYLPFQKESKIIKLEQSSLKLKDNLPIIDGAAAVFPVYSSFVNSIYPETTELYEGVFEYNNTSVGYRKLAEKETDIFFGAYPSKEQIEYAEENGTEFEYTPIGYEAFVFFVHKDNPIESLTTEQIKGIYSGEITNWSEVGGHDKPIVAYQRNEGSGSQSMLKRFMDNTPIATPPTEQVNDLMSGIIDKVADYKSTTASIGFSFRYYVEGIIKNPDIKIIAIDGVKPTIENIQTDSYPIITPLYAVTYKDNPNENIQLFIDWVLSEEGQTIIKETGYTPIN